MFKIKCCWNPWEDYLKQTVEKVAIRCSNCGKETMIDVHFLDTTYKEICFWNYLARLTSFFGVHECIRICESNVFDPGS